MIDLASDSLEISDVNDLEILIDREMDDEHIDEGDSAKCLSRLPFERRVIGHSVIEAIYRENEPLSGRTVERNDDVRQGIEGAVPPDDGEHQSSLLRD